MERGCLKIGKPEVIDEGEKSVLRAEIDDDGVKKCLEFKVDSKWGKYLTWERSDAFVLALMYYALVKNKDIVWETPCNKQMIYQLQTYYIPIVSEEMAFMHSIQLIGPTTAELLPSENGVATGFSNGVDSSYTVHKYLSYDDPAYRLTHVIFTDWWTTYYPEEYQKDFLKNYLDVLPKCTEELGLEFIYVKFHLDDQFSIGVIKDKKCGTLEDLGLYTFKYCAIPMALQKLLHIFYYSSSFAPCDLSFSDADMTHHDIVTVPLISSPAMNIYLAGMEEKTRIGKTRAIADWEYAQKHLQVCPTYNDTNCGHCKKCHYTMGTLYALGKLDSFSAVFPVEDFKSHLPQRFGYILGKATGGHIHSYEVIEWMRKNNVKIPATAYLYIPFHRINDFARKHLRTKPWARRLYKKLHLNKLMNKYRRFDTSGRMDEMILGKKDK